MAGNNSFMTSFLALVDDDKFMKDVMSKPCSGTEQVDVNYHLSLIEKILNPEGNQGQIKSLTSPKPVPLSSTIDELCCQITCETLHTNNVRRTMESLFDKLSSFSWDAKAVLTLSALSVYYAENWHLAQIEKSDHYIGLAAVLRGPRAGNFALGAQALKDLIRVTLDFTKCVVKFANDYKDSGALLTSIDIKASFYFIIFGVLGCSVQFSGMIGKSKEFQRLDLSPFSTWVRGKYESFKKELEKIDQIIEEQIYKEIKQLSRTRTDIVKFMARLFCTEKDSGTVNQGFEKTTVKVEQLQNKNVMLLISDLTLANEDLITLTSIYHESRFKSRNYEIMWVPVVDVKDDEQFRNKRSQMPWYSCNSTVRKAAARFIKKYWQFKQQTKVVVLNQRGEVVNTDAMTMIRLWGLEALPFTQEMGGELWRGRELNWLNLVVNNTVFQTVEQSFESEELIFLYGSAEDSKIVEDIEVCLSKIKSYFSSFRVFNINTKRKQFLTRLENCISSKMQVSTNMSDPLTQQLLQLYTSYKKQSGFAIIAMGSTVSLNTSLTSLVTVLSQHQKWIKKVTHKQDFYTLLQTHYDKVIVKPQCYEFKIPNMVGNIPDYNKCPNCPRSMEIVVTFKCCHGAH